MKTILECDENKELELDNTSYDNRNYLDLIIETYGTIDGNRVNVGTESICVSIDDLYSALTSFLVSRDMSDERDARYSRQECEGHNQLD